MKKVIKTVALSVSALALAATASAADLELNIYGASAQGKFWNEYAKAFVEAPVANGGAGCTGTTIVGYADSSKKLGITVGQNCALTGSNDKVIIRYTANKSVEGPRAVMNLDPQSNDSCISGQPFDNLRKQADWSSTEGFTQKCKEVHVGASDVGSEAFTQESHGQKNGLFGGGQYDEVLLGQNIPGLTQIGTVSKPLVIPFAFFANNNLEINHINRQQALLLFSGQVHTWSQFGPGYPEKTVGLCMRHAGSGTHATLDKAIMRGDAFLASNEFLDYYGLGVGLPQVMFHESSTNALQCLQENGRIVDGAHVYPPSEVGVIGYLDADAITNTTGYLADGTEVNQSAATNVKRLRYNGGAEGMTPANFTAYGHSQLKNDIINGSYEFWAPQWLYIDKTQETPSTINLYNKMMAYAASRTLPCPGLGCYWLTGDELKVNKANDSAIPVHN